MGKPFLYKKGKEFVFIIHLKRLVSKSLSALCSTSLQHLSACGRCHSLTETVYFTSLSLFGLIRSFHFSFSYIGLYWPFFILFFIFRGLAHDKSFLIITKISYSVKQFCRLLLKLEFNVVYQTKFGFNFIYLSFAILYKVRHRTVFPLQ